jgi:hypothetical protein
LEAAVTILDLPKLPFQSCCSYHSPAIDGVDALEQSLFPPSLSILSCLESFLQATKTLTEDSRRCARLRLCRAGAAACCSCAVAGQSLPTLQLQLARDTSCSATAGRSRLLPSTLRTPPLMLKTSHGILSATGEDGQTQNHTCHDTRQFFYTRGNTWAQD